MFPKQHLVVSTIWAAASLPALGKRTPIAWASSILIDVDHYLWYAIHFRNLSLQDALDYFYTTPPRRRTPSLNVFHTIEFLGLLAAVSNFSAVLRAVLYGFLFHILADTYYDIRVGTLFRRRRSIILSFLRPRTSKA
ncbi:MAG: hypothetical protein M1319_03335 [Chloroflexi bacterium]|nr:hypothetical protein [Chloroflexota bacterium]